MRLKERKLLDSVVDNMMISIASIFGVHSIVWFTKSTTYRMAMRSIDDHQADDGTGVGLMLQSMHFSTLTVRSLGSLISRDELLKPSSSRR